MRSLLLLLIGQVLWPGGRALKCFLSGFTQQFTENDLRVVPCDTYCVKITFNTTTREPFSDRHNTKRHEVKYCDNMNECQFYQVPGPGRARGGCRLVNSADYMKSPADVDKALDYELCCCGDKHLCNDSATALSLCILLCLLLVFVFANH